MSEPTFHTVSWAPSAIKDAVAHATDAMKLSDGTYARVATFELSALIDATRALIAHNEQDPEARILSHALLLNSYRGYKDQVDALVRRVQVLQAENERLAAELAVGSS